MKSVRIPVLVAAAWGVLACPASAQSEAQTSPTPTMVKLASELPAWRTVSLGLHRSVDAFRNAFDKAHMAIGDSADEILGRPAFTFAKARRDLDLVVVSVADLGFGEAGAPLSDIHARGLALGLALCPEEVGPQLRLQYLHQPIGEFLHVAMKPLRTYGGTPVDFTLANGGAGLALLGGEATPDLVIPGTVRFVFARRYRELLPAEWIAHEHGDGRWARSRRPFP